MTATVGFSGCQTFRFPANPFAGAKLPGARIPVPRLPSLGKFPKPNFGNIASAIKTPAQQAINSSGNSIASANKQPPPAPNRKFDSTATDEKLAQSIRAGGKASAEGTTEPDFSIAKSDTNGELTPAQKRFKQALAKQRDKNSDLAAKANSNSKSNSNADLWSDYRPDASPSSSNSLPANSAQELAKVNRGLYDQYGKLTTGSSSPKLSEPFDPKSLADKSSDGGSAKTDQSIAGLRSQLEQLKARGSGNSDGYSVPTRTALEIAGTAPQTPAATPQVKLHKGFGGSAQLKSASNLANRGTVSIPDPTAPTNVLRASADEIPGLVQVTNVAEAGKYSATRFGGFAGNNTQPSELPTGSLLPQNSAGSEDLVANKFVQKTEPLKLPTLTATAESKPIEMALPRPVSEASLAALAENARAAEAAPKPKITFQNPIQQMAITMPQQAIPDVSASPATPAATTLATTTAVSTPAVSAFNLPATRSPRVTKNQFFSRPIQASAPLNTPAAPVQRVAQVQQDTAPLSIMNQPESAATALPAGLVTGDSTYAPGSVVKPQNESRWR
jgi:hypothetical protein